MTQKKLRSKNQSYEKLYQIINKIPLNKFALRSRFKQRKAQKINAKNLILAFFMMAMRGRNTFEQWASYLSIQSGVSLSRQGLFDRINGKLVDMLWLVLQHCIEKQNASTVRLKKCSLEGAYTEIYICDSTVIPLPAWLGWAYPGNTSRGKRKSQLKIQVIYGQRSNRVVYLCITPYTTNDQSQAENILEVAQAKTLVLRDLGYFSLGSMNKMQEREIAFISLLKYAISIRDIRTQNQINLAQVLKKKGHYDGEVLLGRTQSIQVRLVAVKLNEKQAAQRRRRARADRDRRMNHSPEYYRLLGYKIFITSESRDKLNARQICDAYRIRWRIESIFKSWKSIFNLGTLIPQSRSITKERVEATILLLLIFILLFQIRLYGYMRDHIRKRQQQEISLHKLSLFIQIHFDEILSFQIKELIPKILYQCRYDKRNDRLNYEQMIKLA